jgi:polysaccharide biosynthesis/export protein
MRTGHGVVACTLIIFFAAAACAQQRRNSGAAVQSAAPVTSAGQASPEPQLQRRNPRYHLQISDTIQIDFPLTPEFAQTVTVQPDGYITLRDVGDLKVAGQTLPELTQTLRRAYGKTLHDPIINVDLKDFQRPYFIASGMVGKPGKYELRDDTTVTEALAIAGGLSTDAKHSQVLLFHKVSENWAEVKKLDVKHMLRAGNLSEDVRLQPGDMLYVPQNTVSKVRPYIPLPNIGIYGPRF